MDKKIAGLLGAVAGIATVGAAQASTEPTSTPSETTPARTYAELLAPIANPVEQLQADDMAREQAPVQTAQYYPYGYGYRYPRADRRGTPHTREWTLRDRARRRFGRAIEPRNR